MSKSREEIEEWLVEKVSQIVEIPPDEIEIEEPFANYGLSSMDTVSISGELEEWLDKRLSPTLLFDYPTIEQMAQHLSEEE